MPPDPGPQGDWQKGNLTLPLSPQHLCSTPHPTHVAGREGLATLPGAPQPPASLFRPKTAPTVRAAMMNVPALVTPTRDTRAHTHTRLCDSRTCSHTRCSHTSVHRCTCVQDLTVRTPSLHMYADTHNRGHTTHTASMHCVANSDDSEHCRVWRVPADSGLCAGAGLRASERVHVCSGGLADVHTCPRAHTGGCGEGARGKAECLWGGVLSPEAGRGCCPAAAVTEL